MKLIDDQSGNCLVIILLCIVLAILLGWCG
jgi:hypothetical protein